MTYQPELRSIPLSYLDCPCRNETLWSTGEVMHWCMDDTKYPISNTFKYAYCEGAMKHGKCPKGFAV